MPDWSRPYYKGPDLQAPNRHTPPNRQDRAR